MKVCVLFLILSLQSIMSFAIAAAVPSHCLDMGYKRGPFDVNNLDNYEPNPAYPKGRHHMVVIAHFTKPVRQLKIEANPAGNIHYVLRMFPNHASGLEAASRYHYKNIRQPDIPSLLRKIDCYFAFAKKFRHQDPVIYFIHGLHFHRGNDLPNALKQYQIAKSLNLSTPEFYYNFGLLYFDMKEFALADKYAILAKESGYPMQGLRNKLNGLNK